MEDVGKAYAATCHHFAGEGLALERGELRFAGAAAEAVILLADAGGFEHFGQKARFELFGNGAQFGFRRCRGLQTGDRACW